MPTSDRSSTAPVPVLLDTDMGNDVDDALALTMLHSLQRRDECRLLGVTLSKDNPWAAAYTRLVNARCGAPDLPVGKVRDGATPEEGPFIRAVTQACGGEPPSADTPEAVSLLRRLLAAQEDRSVVIVTIGFFTNLSRLLDSPADALSPLDGRTLLARKVKSVCSMAGNFMPRPEQSSGPDIGNPEFNIRTDIAASRNFIHHCPCPIVFSGFEIGDAVLFPGAAIEPLLAREPLNPVAAAYAAYLPLPYDRQSWDQTAVLQAVRPQAGYFDLSSPGRVQIDAEGYSTFHPEKGGPHRLMALNAASHRAALDAIIELSTEFPVSTAALIAKK